MQTTTTTVACARGLVTTTTTTQVRVMILPGEEEDLVVHKYCKPIHTYVGTNRE